MLHVVRELSILLRPLHQAVSRVKVLPDAFDPRNSLIEDDSWLPLTATGSQA